MNLLERFKVFLDTQGLLVASERELIYGNPYPTDEVIEAAYARDSSTITTLLPHALPHKDTKEPGIAVDKASTQGNTYNYHVLPGGN
jgi:hypothetical protein